MKKALMVAAVLMVALAFASQASAVQITGSFAIAGPFEWTDNTGASVPLGTATSLDMRTIGLPNTATPGVAGTFSVTDSQGTLGALLPVGTIGDIKDISYKVAGSNLAFPFPPVIAFESAPTGLPTVTVDLLALTFVQTACSVGCDLTLPSPFIVLQGTTTINATGFDPTPGTFTFQGNQSGGSFAFAASNVAVPEPGTLILLGLGLSGVAVAGRLRKK